MRLLELITELNSNRINPTFDDLLQLYCNSKTSLRFYIFELMERRYLEEIEMTDDGVYTRTGYMVTEKGKHAFDRYVSQVKYFVSRLDQLYEKDESDNLYRALEDNRFDMLRFAYYKGLITKAQIEKIANKLEISVERIWWGDSQGGFYGGVSI